MAVVVLFSLLFMGLVGHSSAAYCVCKDGSSEAQLQKNIDYACGNGADCSAINQNGACYNPNTIKDHCNYAVNSYYQKRVSSGANCDFSGTATLTANLPSQPSGSCSYPSSAGSAGGTTSSPTTNPLTPPTSTGSGTGTGTGTGTPPTGTGTGTGTPPTGTGTGTGTSTGTGTGTGAGTGTGIGTGTGTGITPTFGLAPTGTTTGISPDGSATMVPSKSTILVALGILFLSLVRPPRI